MSIKKRKLRLFNGRVLLPDGKQGQGYIAAYSMSDAARLLDEITGGRGNLNEIRIYWSHDCWGNKMEGVEPERGLWVCALDNYNQKPKRVTALDYQVCEKEGGYSP